jgi:hypothetical protein
MHEALLAGRLDVVLAPTELALDLELVKVDEVYVESTHARWRRRIRWPSWPT